MRHLICAALLALSAPVAAQVPDAELETLRPVVKKIHERALSERRTYATLRELCRVAPRRLAGTPAAAAAVEWGRQTMLAAGLENVRLEPCMVPRWVRGEKAILKVTAPEAGSGERLPILALGGSVGTPAGGVTAEVLEVQGIEDLKARAAEAKGKIVFFNRPFPATEHNTFKGYGQSVDQRSRGPAEAARVGAVGAVVRSMTPNLDDIPHTGGTRNPDDVPPVPAVAVSTNGAERIAGLLRRGPVRLHLEVDCKTLADVPSWNVVGELRGRELPEQVVVVGGHLDSWDVGEGAHDCGAGCCQSIEALRLLKAEGLRPRRTLRAVLFMNEENGLRGGKAYAEAHGDEEHVAAIESDRGGFSPRGFTSDAGPQAMPVLRSLGSLLPAGAGNVIEGYGGADISTLKPFGVVQIGFLPDPQRYFDLHHTAADTFDKVNWRELELGTAAIASLAYGLAELETRLPANTVTKKGE